MSEDTMLADRIETVSNATADGERLVSVGIPPEASLEETRRRVEADHAEAEYLDVREEVQRPLKQALDETRRILHDYEETPAQGLAVYAGEVGADLETAVFDDLPNPVDGATYGYANEFDTDPLEPTVSPTGTYGLLVVGRESAAIGRYDGTSIQHVETVESDVPSKQAAAGRNEDRFQGRSRERAAEFFDAVGEAAADVALDPDPAEESSDASAGRELAVEGLLLGGSEVVVEEFRDGDHLPERLADAVEATCHVEYAAETGLRDLVDAAERNDALEGTDARDALDRFLDALGDGEDPAVGGREDVEEALSYDAVDTLLVADSVEPATVQPLTARAADQGGDTVVVPDTLDRTERLESAFDGVGAVLRFPLD